MKLRFSIVAQAEIQAATDYYESKEPGLGLRFVAELDRAIKLILQFPTSWSPFSRRSRRYVLRRFPYHIIYSVQQDTVMIVTVVHQRRDPKRWQSLIQDLGL